MSEAKTWKWLCNRPAVKYKNSADKDICKTAIICLEYQCPRSRSARNAPGKKNNAPKTKHNWIGSIGGLDWSDQAPGDAAQAMSRQISHCPITNHAIVRSGLRRAALQNAANE